MFTLSGRFSREFDSSELFLESSGISPLDSLSSRLRRRMSRASPTIGTGAGGSSGPKSSPSCSSLSPVTCAVTVREYGDESLISGVCGRGTGACDRGAGDCGRVTFFMNGLTALGFVPLGFLSKIFSVFTGRLFEILNPPGSRVSDTGKGLAVEFDVLIEFVCKEFVLGANGFGAFPAGLLNAGFSAPNFSVISDANEDVVGVCPKENPLDICEFFGFEVCPKLNVAVSAILGFSEIVCFSKGFIELDSGS